MKYTEILQIFLPVKLNSKSTINFTEKSQFYTILYYSEEILFWMPAFYFKFLYIIKKKFSLYFKMNETSCLLETSKLIFNEYYEYYLWILLIVLELFLFPSNRMYLELLGQSSK